MFARFHAGSVPQTPVVDARTDRHAVQSLRFRVFNEELNEGLATASATGRDEDERDPWFHHLMISHRESGQAVGTYRLQTAVMTDTRFGFYSATRDAATTGECARGR